MDYHSIPFKDLIKIGTLGELNAAGYQTRSVKRELRENLITRLNKGQNPFPGIYGYENSVIPDLERAILSMHDINLLGLRGQAKTKLARMMVNLLDEYIPVITGSELNDDPYQPISRFGKDEVEKHGDHTPITWLHRDLRYTEKLATPDVSIADLIGDVDPIKAANLRLPYSDERVIHFGLIPRSHRGIFVFNELPDLQARIQVALFNILQEGDIQIRGFKVRLMLEIQFVFTANPEDYTNRGSIVTPLKDRIDSQIITHYPKSIEIGKKITEQEAQIKEEQLAKVTTHELIKDLVEQIAIEARQSEYVDDKSGVSARLTISAYENLFSSAERRTLINNEKKVSIRIGDFTGTLPAITGKIELVYEGEQEGAGIVAQNLVGKAIRSQFEKYFPNPEKVRKSPANAYKSIIDWFGEGNKLDLFNDLSEKEFKERLDNVPGLKKLVNKFFPKADASTETLMMEFALHGLAEFSMLSKNNLEDGLQFKDLLSSMFAMPGAISQDTDDAEDLN
jgi:magnesium chelatase subunit I